MAESTAPLARLVSADIDALAPGLTALEEAGWQVDPGDPMAVPRDRSMVVLIDHGGGIDAPEVMARLAGHHVPVVVLADPAAAMAAAAALDAGARECVLKAGDALVHLLPRAMARALTDPGVIISRLTEAERRAGVGHWVWHPDADHLEWSAGTHRLFGTDPVRFVPTLANALACVHPEDRDRVRRMTETLLRHAGAQTVEFRVQHPSGAVRHMLSESVARFDDRGQVVQIFGTVLDITRPKRVESALRRLSQRNSLILEAAGEGIIGLDLGGRITFANAAAERLTGLSRKELIGRDQHVLMHHSDAEGRPMAAKNCRIHAALRDGRQEAVDDEVFWRSDGRSFPVEYVVSPMIEHGRVTGAVMVFSDITDRRQAEAEMRQARDAAAAAQARLCNALEAISEGFVLWDRNDRLVMCNSRYRELLAPIADRLEPGAAFEAVLRAGLDQGLFLDARGDEDRWLRERLDIHRHPGARVEEPLATGRWLAVKEFRTPDGEHVGIRTDITHQKELEADLHRLATTDPLTGLANRRYFMEVAARELVRARRHGRPLALLVLDLDHFKAVNDGHGHETGDRMLVAVADACGTTLRSIDLLARMGGEEFAVLLPETDRDGAWRAAERLREVVAAVSVTTDDATVTARVSIGGTVLAGADGDIKDLLRRADRALYRAKDAGRDRVEMG